jgi:hypothetical protein
LVSKWDLLQIVSCIELTIPFRPKNSQAETPPDLLEKRITQVSKSLNIAIGKHEIKNAVKSAVDIANRDVIGFSFEDFGRFSAQTWQLILEGNPVFKNPMFTISQYRSALLKVEKFYSQLNPALIYHEYDHPNVNNHQTREKIKRAKSNLAIGIEYFQTKLLTMAFLEAIAELTGGDAPLVLFAGQLSQKDVKKPIVMEDFLDMNIPEHTEAKPNPKVLEALDDMLFDALSLDTKKEHTMSSYIYTRTAQSKRLELFDCAKALFDKKLNPTDYLGSMDEKVRNSLIHAIAAMASTRKPQILELVDVF